MNLLRAPELISKSYVPSLTDWFYEASRELAPIALDDGMLRDLEDALAFAQRLAAALAVLADLEIFAQILFVKLSADEERTLRDKLADPEAIRAIAAQVAGRAKTRSARAAYEYHCRNVLSVHAGVPFFFDRNPNAKLLLDRLAQNFVGNLKECATRVRNDRLDIQSCFLDGQAITAIRKIVNTGSDSHRGGRQVLFLDLQSKELQRRIVYKPGNVEIDYVLAGKNTPAVVAALQKQYGVGSLSLSVSIRVFGRESIQHDQPDNRFPALETVHWNGVDFENLDIPSYYRRASSTDLVSSTGATVVYEGQEGDPAELAFTHYFETTGEALLTQSLATQLPDKDEDLAQTIANAFELAIQGDVHTAPQGDTSVSGTVSLTFAGENLIAAHGDLMVTPSQFLVELSLELGEECTLDGKLFIQGGSLLKDHYVDGTFAWSYAPGRTITAEAIAQFSIAGADVAFQGKASVFSIFRVSSRFTSTRAL